MNKESELLTPSGKRGSQVILECPRAGVGKLMVNNSLFEFRKHPANSAVLFKRLEKSDNLLESTGPFPGSGKMMKAFLRKNLMMVVSIGLPLIVALFFALASILPGLYTDPPAYDLLISLQDWGTSKSSPVKVDFVIRGGKLKVMVSKTDNRYFSNNPRLFRYSHETGEASEISIPIPENIAELNEGSEISVPALAGLKVSDALRAPDGYEFRRKSNGGGLMTEMFGGSRSWGDVSIAKNGAVVRIRLPVSDYWYTDVRFIAWVIEQGE